MFPFLIRQGSFIIPTFSFMLMIASLAATFYAYWRAPSKKLSQTAVLDIGIIGTLAGIIGSRLFHVFVEEPKYYWAHPERIVQVWNGGFVSYGAILLIGISLFIYLKKKKLPILKYLDLFALSFPLVFLFVRIGCLGAGCCYGKQTNFFFHLVFHSGDAGYKYYGLPLHATQIYEMFNAVLMFVVLHLIDRKKQFDGQVIWTFLPMYGLARFIIEFFRGDIERGVYGGGIISTGQIMGILSVIFGLSLYFFCKKLDLKQKNRVQ